MWYSRVGIATVVLCLFPSCVNSKSPETCLLFEANEATSKRIRAEASAIAARRKMEFADKSGEHPWRELAIYFELEGKGVDVMGQQRKENRGWICFYGQKEKEVFQLVVRDFSEFFKRENIAFEVGRP